MKYIRTLDSLSAIAVLIVVFHHLPITSDFKLLSTVFLGITGVDIFFILSGFLITTILLEAKNNEIENKQIVKSFYWRRFLRIFPIYYLTIIVLVLLNVESYRSEAFYDVFYISNFYMGLNGEFTSVTPHFWSLAVEEQFYLIWPVLIIFLPLRKIPTMVLLFFLIGLISLIYTFDSDSSFFGARTFNNWLYLSLGGIISILYLYQKGWSELLKKMAGFYLVFYIAWKLIMYYSQWQLGREWDIVINILFAAFMVIRFTSPFKTKFFNSLFSNDFIVYIGKISYGIYLYHFLMIIPLSIILKLFPSHQLDVFELNVLKVFLCLFVASLSWHFLEKPILAYKDKFNVKTK